VSLNAAAADGGSTFTHAELRHTGETLDKGDFVYHPLFFRSAVGLTDSVELRFQTLGLINGPALGVGYNLMDSDSGAATVNLDYDAYWDMGANGPGWLKLSGDYTTKMNGNFLSFKLGVDTRLGDISPWIPFGVRYDLVTSDKDMFRFGLSSDARSLANGTLYGTIAAHWYHSMKKFRLGLGVDALAGDLGFAEFMAVFGIDVPELILFPAPHIEMWFKF